MQDIQSLVDMMLDRHYLVKALLHKANTNHIKGLGLQKDKMHQVHLQVLLRISIGRARRINGSLCKAFIEIREFGNCIFFERRPLCGSEINV